MKALADEVFEVRERTSALYRELCRVRGRLGTPREKPGDLDAVLRFVQEVNKALTATSLYRRMLTSPPREFARQFS